MVGSFPPLGVIGVGPQSLTAQVPRLTTKFQVDPYWPKILPNDWIWVPIGGVCVAAKDHVWVIEWTADLKEEAAPWRGDSYGPPVIQYDAECNKLVPSEIRRPFQPVFTAVSLIATGTFSSPDKMTPSSRSTRRTANCSCTSGRS